MGIGVATWNAQWATASSDRGQRISAILSDTLADVLVVTEGERNLLPAEGSVVDAGDNWGYGSQDSRRKVLVWSRYPLAVEHVGTAGATRGRLVTATMETPDGPARIIGVCIPWRDAHVSTGRGDARPWSEHMDYLNHLNELLAALDDTVPTIIAGDFNQRIPRGRQPIVVAERLSEVLAGWTIHTAGDMPNGPHIDHIATNHRLILEAAHDWPALDHRGRLSDHAGVACRLKLASGPAVGPDQAAAPPEPQREHAPAHDRTFTEDSALPPVDPCATGQAPAQGGGLTPELRAEIEDLLRRSSDGLSHGATFRLREQGLTEAQIAAERGVSVSATRVFLRSLDALLSGSVPTTKSLALTNSYVYRELLNHPRSENLDSYVRAQLRKLQGINPEVTFSPLQTRSHQYRVGTRKKARPVEDSCPECAAVGIIHSGRC